MVVAAPPAVAPASAPVAGVHQASNPAPNGWIPYVVRSGDSTYAIAATYRTSVAVLVAKNHLPRNGQTLQVGQRLLVPRTAAQAAADKAAAAKVAAAKAAAVAAAKAAAAPRFYVVRSGDTLAGIADRNKLTLARLLKLNGMTTRAVIHPGQKIRLPGTVGAAAAAAKPAKPAKPAAPTTQQVPTLHTVKTGDTLAALAVRYGTTVGGIMRAAGLKSSVIYPGQKVIVKMTTVTVSPAKKPTIAPPSATPTRTQVKAMIIATARRHGVDPKLALAIGWQESGWQHNLVSEANALGIMQVIPDAGAWASSMVGRTLDLRNPQDNVTAGVVILRALTRMAANQDQAIAAYYQGLASVRARGPYEDTKGYVTNVKALMKRM